MNCSKFTNLATSTYSFIYFVIEKTFVSFRHLQGALLETIIKIGKKKNLSPVRH